MRSTRPSVTAGIQRVSSGTSVPTPRTCRTIDPRFTVSVSTVERSTLGAAGSMRARAADSAITSSSPTMPPATCRCRLRFRIRGSRAISTMGPEVTGHRVCQRRQTKHLCLHRPARVRTGGLFVCGTILFRGRPRHAREDQRATATTRVMSSERGASPVKLA